MSAINAIDAVNNIALSSDTLNAVALQFEQMEQKEGKDQHQKWQIQVGRATKVDKQFVEVHSDYSNQKLLNIVTRNIVTNNKQQISYL